MPITDHQHLLLPYTNEGVHYEEIFKPGPDGKQDFTDATRLVDRLRANDAYAKRLAENSLDFAHTYLTRETMLPYLVKALGAYKELFTDEMDKYMTKVGDPGAPDLFIGQAKGWRSDWRTFLQPPQANKK